MRVFVYGSADFDSDPISFENDHSRSAVAYPNFAVATRVIVLVFKGRIMKMNRLYSTWRQTIFPAIRIALYLATGVFVLAVARQIARGTSTFSLSGVLFGFAVIVAITVLGPFAFWAVLRFLVWTRRRTH